MSAKQFFYQIFQSGFTKETPETLARNIYFSNIIAMIVAFGVALPFVFLTYFFFRPIVLLPAAAVVTAIFAYFLIRFGLHYIGRTILSLLPVLLTTVYQAFLVMPGEDLVGSIAYLQLSFAIIPFLIFSISEWRYIIFSGITIFVLLVFGTQYLANTLVIEMETEIIRTGILSYVAASISALLTFGALYLLAMVTQTAIQKSEELLSKTHINNASLQQSEEELKKRMLEIEEAQIEEKKRNWSTTGLSELGSILQSRGDLSEICERVLQHLVKYMNVTQGGLYLVDEDAGEIGEIELVACYAYDRKKFVNKKIEIKEGLLGSAYMERDYIHISEIPEDYMRIRSGLGDATPSTLLIMPMIVNEKVEGLIELATFSRFEDYQIDFLRDSGITIAASVSNIKVNEQTRQLLDVSQKQAEEMRAQEEEMRQNQEELQATQEEMERQRSEMKSEIASLKAQVASAKALS